MRLDKEGKNDGFNEGYEKGLEDGAPRDNDVFKMLREEDEKKAQEAKYAKGKKEGFEEG